MAWSRRATRRQRSCPSRARRSPRVIAPPSTAAAADATSQATIFVGDLRVENRLYRVIQPVQDIDAAARFYSKVLSMPGERVSPGRHYFACGGTILACYDAVADGDELGEGWRHHPNQYIYFATDDLKGTLERVRGAGGRIEAPIDSMPWGETMFYARDPFGNPISFVDQGTLFVGAQSAAFSAS